MQPLAACGLKTTRGLLWPDVLKTTRLWPVMACVALKTHVCGLLWPVVALWPHGVFFPEQIACVAMGTQDPIILLKESPRTQTWGNEARSEDF